MRNPAVFVVILAGAAVATAAHANTWHDATFENMVGTADSIAVVEVLEAGTAPLLVTATEVLKGAPPKEPFYVDGYVDAWGPPAPNVAKGARFLAFLNKAPLFPVKEKRDRHQELFAPTPTSGWYPVTDDIVRMKFHTRSYWRVGAGTVDLSLARALVMALVDGTQAAATAATVRKRLSSDFVRNVLHNGTGDRVIGDMDALVWGYLAFNGDDRTSEFVELTRSPNGIVQGFAARALQRSKLSTDVVNALSAVVRKPDRDESAFPRAEATETLAVLKVPSAELAKLLRDVRAAEPPHTETSGPDYSRWWEWTAAVAALVGAMAAYGDVDPREIQPLLASRFVDTQAFSAAIDFFDEHPDDAAATAMMGVLGYSPRIAMQRGLICHLLTKAGERGRIAVFVRATDPGDFLPPNARLTPLDRQVLLEQWSWFASWGDPRVAEAAQAAMSAQPDSFPPARLVLKSKSLAVVNEARKKITDKAVAWLADPKQAEQQSMYFKRCTDVAEAYARNAPFEDLLGLLTPADFCELLPGALVETAPPDAHVRLISALRAKLSATTDFPRRAELLKALNRLGINARQEVRLTSAEAEQFDDYLNMSDICSRPPRLASEGRQAFSYTPRTQK